MNRAYLAYVLARKVCSHFGSRPLETEEFLFARVLERAGCSAVVITNPEPGLCRAAHARGMTVVYVFHGIGYSSPRANSGGDRAERPDLFLSLDSVSTARIRPLLESGQSVIEIDHPWFSRFDRWDGPTDCPNEWRLSDDLRTALEAYSKVILLSLRARRKKNTLAPGDTARDEVLAESIVKAMDETHKDVLWLVRLHPVQLRGREHRRDRAFVRRLEESRANVVSSQVSLTPLPALLACCSGHVTMRSMVSYEAAWMGVPSLALCPSIQSDGLYANLFEDLVAAGFLDKRNLDSDLIRDWVLACSRRAEPYSRVTGRSDAAVRAIADLCKPRP